MIRRWAGGKKGGYPSGGGKKGGGKGRRPVPILPGPPGPGAVAVVPPRPKLMPTSPAGMATQGQGQSYQALIWMPQPVPIAVPDDASEDHICFQKIVVVNFK